MFSPSLFSHWTCNSPVWLEWPQEGPRETSVSTSAVVGSELPPTLAFCVDDGNPNSGPHVYTARTLLTKTLLQSLNSKG